MLAASPEIRLLVLSMHEEKIYAERALRAGAHGFVNKSEEPSVVIRAIRSILSGKVHLTPAATEQMLHRENGGGPTAESGDAEQLSKREREVFELIGAGVSSREIAERLTLSMKTVDVYRQRIKEKLGLSGSTELARRAVEWVLAKKKSDIAPENAS
jgi:DNA-binding NarL/FixJ family response regulator